MTVSSGNRKAGPYIGNGVTTAFDFGFKILDESHIAVIKRVGSTDTKLSLSVDYTVSGVDQPSGGQVTMTIAPAIGETVTIIGDVPFSQEVDLENQGAYYAETIEAALDLSVMRDQQLQEQMSRALLQSPSSASSSITLPPSEDGKFLYWNSGELSNTFPSFGIDEPTALNSRGLAEATAFAESVSHFRTAGYYAPGDGGGAEYVRVASEPTFPGKGKVQSVDAKWFKVYGRRPNLRAFGAKGDGSRATQAFKDARDYLFGDLPDGSAVGGVIVVPGGGYRVHEMITIGSSAGEAQVSIEGQGMGVSYIIPETGLGNVFEFNAAVGQRLHRAGIRSLTITHETVPTAGSTILVSSNSEAQSDLFYSLFEDLRISNANTCVTVNNGAVNTKFNRCHFNSHGDGAALFGAAYVQFMGCHFNGVPGTGTNGIHVWGALDGFTAEELCTFEGHDRGINFTPQSGSCANIFINGCAFDKQRNAGIQMTPAAGATISLFEITSCEFFGDTPYSVGAQQGIVLDASSGGAGSIRYGEIRGCYGRFIHQELVHVTGALWDVRMSGLHSPEGSRKSVGNYPMVQLGAGAHRRLSLTDLGASGHGSLVDGGSNSVELLINGGDPTGCTAALGSVGDAGLKRQFKNILGLRDRGGGELSKICIGTYANMPASQSVPMSTTYVAPRKQRLVGIGVSSTSGRTGGALTATAHVSGNATALAVSLNATQTTAAYNSLTEASCPVINAGQSVVIRLTTDGTWAPTNSTLWAYIEAEDV